jgi:hypothetical protein
MAFPHTKPRKGHYGNNDKPNTDGVLWNFFNRTINIAKYRNAKTMWIQGTIERLVASFMIDFSPIYRRPGIILLWSLNCVDGFQSIRAKTCSGAAKQ